MSKKKIVEGKRNEKGKEKMTIKIRKLARQIE